MDSAIENVNKIKFFQYVGSPIQEYRKVVGPCINRICDFKCNAGDGETEESKINTCDHYHVEQNTPFCISPDNLVLYFEKRNISQKKWSKVRNQEELKQVKTYFNLI